jgi:hypothetical protein
MSMAVEYQVQSFPTTTYGTTRVYSNRFHACFSYSTVPILRFLGLRSTGFSARSCGDEQAAYRTGTRGSMSALCCRLRNRSRKRFPSGYEGSSVRFNKIRGINHLEST